VQRQVVHCVERTSGIVEEHYCDPSSRPDDKQTNCNKGACPAMWWVGEWQKCSSSCGDIGLSKRTVLCIRSLGLDEQRALQPAECHHLPKPESIVRCNTHVSCPADWTTGSWSEFSDFDSSYELLLPQCSVSCGAGSQARDVTCSWNTGVDCDPKAKPNSTMPCYLQDCPINLDTFGNNWSGSGASSKEVFNEIKVIAHFSTTRNQARGNADPNDIIEDDFSHYSHVEKSSDNSIVKNLQVDDFYYDYNFIRFHEDLSYDLDKAENYMFDNSGIKHGDISLTEADVPITTSSPSTTADEHSTTTMRSDSITNKGTESHEPQKKDVLDENNNELFAEDYFLPVITTTETSSAATKLFSTWKNIDIGLSQDISVTRNPPLTADVFTQDKQTLSYEIVPNIFLTPEPHIDLNRNSNNHDHYKGNQKDKTKMPITEDENEEEFGEGDPGGESEPHHGTQNYKPHLDYVFKFETYENRHVNNPTTPLQWSTASPTVLLSATSHPLELLSSATSDDFAKYKVLTEPAIYTKASEPWVIVREFITTSDSLSQEYVPSPTSSVPAKHYSSMTSAAGTTALRPTEMESDFKPDTTIAAETQSWYSKAIAPTKTNGPRKEPWGTPVPLPHWTEIDNNKIVIAKMLRPARLNNTLSTLTEQPSQGTSNEHSVHTNPLMPTGLVMPSLSTSASPAPWKKGNWSACSELCGGGEQQRLVTCPETEKCDEDLQPSNIQACNVHPCNQWISGSWGQCSVSCGGGVQRRLVKCVNTKAKLEDETEHVDCDHEPRPKNTKKCNIQDCDSTRSVIMILRSVVFTGPFDNTLLSDSPMARPMSSAFGPRKVLQDLQAAITGR
ncbi:hypothetical protein cypCar_00009479, partial [Cyprinus carpio]